MAVLRFHEKSVQSDGYTYLLDCAFTLKEAIVLLPGPVALVAIQCAMWSGCSAVRLWMLVYCASLNSLIVMQPDEYCR